MNHPSSQEGSGEFSIWPDSTGSPQPPALRPSSDAGQHIIALQRAKHKSTENSLRLILQQLQTKHKRCIRRLARTYCNLSISLRYQGRLAEAESHQCRSLAYRLRELGEHHHETIFSMSNLSVLLHRQQKTHLAKVFAERAFQGYQRIYGRNHWRSLAALHNLAMVYASIGELDYANSLMMVALLRNQLTMRDRRGYVRVLASMICVAWIQHRRGSYQHAVQLYGRVSLLLEKIAPPDSPLKVVCQKLASAAERGMKIDI